MKESVGQCIQQVEIFAAPAGEEVPHHAKPIGRKKNMRKSIAPAALLATLAIAWAGCSSPNGPSATPSNSSADPHASHDHSGNQAESGQSDMDKMKAELAKLSPEDAAAAQRQHICPVSGEMLGTMGPPLKIDVKGQKVWICCEGCKEKLLASPDEYLAKVKKE